MFTFITALLCFLLLPAVVGLFTLFHLFRSSQSPADTSNRINKIRLWWFVMTREDLFVGTFPWLQNDELDNIKQVKEIYPDETNDR